MIVILYYTQTRLFRLYMFVCTVFFVLIRRIKSWSLSKYFRNTLYIKKSWERGDEGFIFIKVGGAKMHNAMLHYYRACQIFPLRCDFFQHAHATEKTALSRNWKKTPIGIRMSVSKVYVTVCGAAANWGLEGLFVEFPRSQNIYTRTHGRTSSSSRPLPIHNTQQNKERKFQTYVWILTRNPTTETDADIHNKPVSYWDLLNQYGILSLYLC
jgi:hypothetical protein